MKSQSSKLEASLAFLSVALLLMTPFLYYCVEGWVNTCTPLEKTFVMLFPQGVMLLALILIYIFAIKKGLFSVFNMTWSKSFSLKLIFKEAFIGIGLVIATSIILRITYYFLNYKMPPVAKEYLIFQQMPNSSLIVFSISAILIAPIVEELIMRKCVFDAFYRFLSRLSDPIPMTFSISKPTLTTTVIFSAIFTSILFALQHFEWIKFAPIFVFGLYLQYLRFKHNSLTPCILVHAINNAITVLFLVLYSKYL